MSGTRKTRPAKKPARKRDVETRWDGMVDPGQISLDDPHHPNDPPESEATEAQKRTDLKARKLLAECHKVEFGNKIMAGKYADVEKVLREIKTVFYRISQAMDAMPGEIAYEVSGVNPGEAESRLAEWVLSVKKQFSEADYPSIEKKLREGEILDNPQANRLPAARLTNGRQKA